MIRRLVYIERYHRIDSLVRRGVVIRIFTGKLSVDLLGVCRFPVEGEGL
jgi:hypothetical protein